MNAVKDVDGTGILSSNDGTSSGSNPLGLLDQGYNTASGAFLIGSVTIELSGRVKARSRLTINQEGTSLFVNADEQIFPEFIPLVMHISLLPEPSTLLLALLALGVVGGWRKGTQLPPTLWAGPST
jgi:hypothetical protein